MAIQGSIFHLILKLNLDPVKYGRGDPRINILANFKGKSRSRQIRALSAHSAAEFNILPSRWQHVWLVAIVPPERWGKMDRNDCYTA
jgi:hypothetical protein